MIVETSALVAILLDEPEAEGIVELILGAEQPRLSAASYVETGIVVDRVGDPVLSRRLDELLEHLGIDIVEVTPEHAREARAAYRDFGRGTGHPAGLNYGDCFGYALAKLSGEALLFKGDDFGHTDVRPAAVP
ncbi:type II toxin-antitoxin system VapC family toxin [Georgenia subflava]|uniref:Ribonuclease VapC n=1 Tax=Georgenia subflava TaxID=1622177 RepID=A0A6N7EJE0_9MICO|nr:type II toxin-antitoxin system VapC family toxin [Georgenia subflava]MPV37158.1 PIN domain-containing protein [Georgenia subflava]